MKLFIQIGIGEWKQSGYDKPLLHYASSLSDDIVGTDLDNESESMVVNLVAQLIGQAEKVFVLIEAHDPKASLGALSKVFHISQEQLQKINRVVLSGDHLETEKIADGWSGKFIKANTEGDIKTLIMAFAQ